MATTFRDCCGREWAIRVTVGSLKRCREVAAIDLLNLFGQEGVAEEAPPIVRFFADLDALGRAVYAVCKPDADSKGVTMEQFLDALAGDALEEARRALLESCVSFFPSPAQRRAFRTVIDEVERVYRQAIEDAERHATPETLRKAMETVDQMDSGEPSTKSPEPSGWIPSI